MNKSAINVKYKCKEKCRSVYRSRCGKENPALLAFYSGNGIQRIKFLYIPELADYQDHHTGKEDMQHCLVQAKKVRAKNENYQ